MPLKESWLAFENATGGRTALRGGPQEARATFTGLLEQLRPLYPPPSGNVEVRAGDVDGIKYQIYTPKGHKGHLPLAVWTHGGGFMLGDSDAEHLLRHTVSEHANMAVISIDYRLSPEVKAPAHMDDSWTVFKWAHKNAASFGADNTQIYTVGGSAGATIALGLANRAIRDEQFNSALKGVVAIVPATVHRQNVPHEYKALYDDYSKEAATAPFIDIESVDFFYAEAGLDPKDSTYFALLAKENHHLFPPTYIISCEYDPLRADAYLFKKALQDAGVKVKHEEFEGLPHYFWMFPQLPETPSFGPTLLAGIDWVKGQVW